MPRPLFGNYFATFFFLLKFKILLNNLDENWNFVSFRRSKWYSNPNFRGSYSSYTLQSDALDVSAEKLAEPINTSNGRPLIQFAGEATNANHFGSVHGAIETGWREANRLIQLYK